MKQHKTRNKALIYILPVLICLVVLLVAVLGKYTVSWEKGFGLKLIPSNSQDVLSAELSDKINSETKHVVFGNSDDYVDDIDRLQETKQHVGASQEDLIYLYYDATTYTTYILCEQTIYFNEDSSDMFAGRVNLLSISYDNINTTKTMDMSGMYRGCSSLTELDLTGFDTTNVTDMTEMFYSCLELATVYAKTTYVTDGVTSSESMFVGCYNLVGGEGTRVYPEGATDTTELLDKTNARIDGLNGIQGFFTDKVGINAYFRSNILKESEQNATYTVYGTEGWLTIANGLDSKTYATSDIEYTVTYYVQKLGEWTAFEKQKKTFEGNNYHVEKYQIAPITDEGITYDSVRIVAENLSGLGEIIEAVVHFNYESYQLSYRYENDVIFLTMITNDDGGMYNVTLADGIIPDNSDPNNIFTAVENGPEKLQIQLEKHTQYEFCFFVGDEDVKNKLDADASYASELVKLAKR